MNGRALVAWNIRKLRVERGISQEQLAADAGIDRSYMSRLERGIENPTVSIIEKLAAVLSAELADFFVVPEPNAEPPGSLTRGRKPRSKPTSA